MSRQTEHVLYKKKRNLALLLVSCVLLLVVVSIKKKSNDIATNISITMNDTEVNKTIQQMVRYEENCDDTLADDDVE